MSKIRVAYPGELEQIAKMNDLRQTTAIMAGCIKMALNELGVPQPMYPQPVANAVGLLNLAMKAFEEWGKP